MFEKGSAYPPNIILSMLIILRSLRERGVNGVVCVTSDAHEGLRRAIEEVFPGAAWERRVVHLMRNAASCAPTRQKRAALLAILRAVFGERDPALVQNLATTSHARR